MTNFEQDVLQLLEEAVSVASASSTGAVRQSEQLAELLNSVSTTHNGAAKTLVDETLASTTSPASAASLIGGGTAASQAVSSINPILGALWSWFGGGEDSGSTTLTKTLLPESIAYQLGVAGPISEPVAVDRDAQGQARSMPPSSIAPSVVVNIQAIDTQSFLDRTPEIAQAVKRALIESGGLTAVMGEL